MTEIFIFTLLLRHQKEVWKNKVYVISPLFVIGTTRVKIVFVKLCFLNIKDT